jgi:hypothetical protein
MAAPVPVATMAAATTAPVATMAATAAPVAAAATVAAAAAPVAATAAPVASATRAVRDNARAARSAVGPKSREAYVWGGCGRGLRRWGAAKQHRPGQRASTHCTGGSLAGESQ